jgi:tRNA threonylcarbamoyladenosine biosynthesis protein TsaB
MADVPILALDTSTSFGSVALAVGGTVAAEIVLRVGAGSSSSLLPAIDDAVRIAGHSPRDLGGVVVAGGPGSFTGLRIAAATAKGLVHALGVPLWSYSGLMAAAAAAALDGTPVCALFDAHRRDLFAACYRIGDGGVETLLEPCALTVDELAATARWGERTVFTGEAAPLYRDELSAVPGAIVVPAHLARPRASALIHLRELAPALGAVADPAGWEPEYVRASGAERIAAERAAAAGP